MIITDIFNHKFDVTPEDINNIIPYKYSMKDCVMINFNKPTLDCDMFIETYIIVDKNSENLKNLEFEWKFKKEFNE